MSFLSSIIKTASKAVSSVGSVAASVVGIGSNYLASHKMSKAMKSAARVSSNATKYAADLQYKQYQQTRNDMEPWRWAGMEALSELQSYKDFSFPDFTFNTTRTHHNLFKDIADAILGKNTGGETNSYIDPSYNFRMKEGLKAIQNSSAAKGMLFSGASAKALTNYASNLASEEYQNAFNRYLASYNKALSTYNTNLNRIQSLAGVGQTANREVNLAGQHYADAVGNLTTNNARYVGNAYEQAANAWAQGYKGIATSINTGIGNALYSKLIK